MKHLSVFFLLLPFVAADFACPASPYALGLICYYQYYSLVGNNFNCSTTYSTGGSYPYLLSLELKNIGENDVISVSWDNTTVSNNGNSFLSIQQYITTNVTISIATGNSSQLAGIYFICKSDQSFITPIPVENVTLAYNSEAFTLQQFTPPPAAGAVNFKAPRKWAITAETQVALISAADTMTPEMKCPQDSCMQLIWIYDGIGDDAKFIGTAADFNNNLYMSKNTTMTLYFVTMDMGTDYMAVIANEARNLEACSSFDVAFYWTLNNLYKNTLNVTGNDGSGACLTVLNHCYNDALCDGVVLYAGLQYGNSGFYVYAGAPNPNPIQNRLGIENYSQQNTFNLFPQNFPGNIRTFYLANGSAILNFGNPNIVNQKPFINRKGFVMTNFYPFYSSNSYGGSLDLDVVGFSYNLTISVTKTYAPPGGNSYLEIDKNGAAVQKMSFDVNTNVGTPVTVHVEAGSSCRIFLWGGRLSNQGSIAFYTIEAGEITTTTTTTRKPTAAPTVPTTTTTPVPTTTTPKPTAASTVPTTTTAPVPTTTTTSAMNTTTVFTTTSGSTVSTTTPKSTGNLYFLLVTVFSLVISLV